MELCYLVFWSTFRTKHDQLQVLMQCINSLHYVQKHMMLNTKEKIKQGCSHTSVQFYKY